MTTAAAPAPAWPRPALQRLLAEVAAGRIEVVLVYKVDRLTRSLADFARIIETCDAQGVAFVSITQQLDTTTSMGRLTLNVLLSFAQFERELTGERIRDKVAAARKKGLWMGGHPPLGYHNQDKRLVLDPAAAATVRLIFERYLALGSVARLKAELDARAIVSASRTSLAGRQRGGKPFSRGALYRLLANRVYLGEVVHRGQAYPGAHEPIVAPARFAAVQDQLAAQARARRHGLRARAPSLLGGLLADDTGAPMSPAHAVKNHKRYRYYVSQTERPDGRRPGRATRVPAHEIETLVRAELQALLRDPGALLDLLGDAAPDLPVQQALLAAAELAERWPTLAPSALSAIVHALIARIIIIGADQVELHLVPEALRRLLLADPELVPSPPRTRACVLRTVPVQLRRCGGEIRLIVSGRAAGSTPARPSAALIKALVRAHAALDRLHADAPPGPRHHLARLLPLAFLAPDITQAILDGTQPPQLTLARLCRPLPLAWPDQRRALGFSSVPIAPG